MSLIASDWLALAVLLCVFAWLAGRWLALALPLAVVVAAGAVYLPTGSPRFTRPPAAEYTVLGAKMLPNVAIWVLLDDGKSEPRYYRLPWSTAQANQLQQAKDAAGDRNGEDGVKAKVDERGGVQYYGPPPVTGDTPKVPEAPAVMLP